MSKSMRAEPTKSQVDGSGTTMSVNSTGDPSSSVRRKFKAMDDRPSEGSTISLVETMLNVNDVVKGRPRRKGNTDARSRRDIAASGIQSSAISPICHCAPVKTFDVRTRPSTLISTNPSRGGPVVVQSNRKLARISARCDSTRKLSSPYTRLIVGFTYPETEKRASNSSGCHPVLIEASTSKSGNVPSCRSIKQAEEDSTASTGSSFVNVEHPARVMTPASASCVARKNRIASRIAPSIPASPRKSYRGKRRKMKMFFLAGT